MSNLQICSSPAVFSSMRALNISELFSISFNVGQNKDKNYFLHFRFLGKFLSVTGLIIPASRLNSSSGVSCAAGFIACSKISDTRLQSLKLPGQKWPYLYTGPVLLRRK